MIVSRLPAQSILDQFISHRIGCREEIRRDWASSASGGRCFARRRPKKISATHSQWTPTPQTEADVPRWRPAGHRRLNPTSLGRQARWATCQARTQLRRYGRSNDTCASRFGHHRTSRVASMKTNVDENMNSAIMRTSPSSGGSSRSRSRRQVVFHFVLRIPISALHPKPDYGFRSAELGAQPQDTCVFRLQSLIAPHPTELKVQAVQGKRRWQKVNSSVTSLM